MSDRAFYAHFSAMSDEQLRSLFDATLESPGSVDGDHSHTWRRWLVEALLGYFYAHPPQTVTDQCRYVAFTLRYLAAIDAGAAAPTRVQQVLTVMATRPEVISTLLFGPVETRRAALRAAFGQPATWEQPALNPYQETSLQAFMQRFVERANDTGMPAFDDSTVARWSRDLIPEMEKLVLDRIKPAQQTVQSAVVREIVAHPRAEMDGSDRARLVGYLEQCEEGSLSVYYGVALAALNDYDRRAENEEQRFKSQRRLVGVMFLLFLIIGGAVLLASWPGLPDWSRTLVVVGFCAAGLGVVATMLYLLINISAGTVTLTEHITRTRTDIQTLHQLVDRTLGPDQE